jgi:hypothetical protein
MKVIGAGLGRTGTLSLKVALERLGFGPCYHMLEVMEHPQHVPLWVAAARGDAVDWEELFAGYQATTDWPACAFWRSLVAAYPAAPVLLTVRDPGRWYDSVRDTIHAISHRELPSPEGLPAAMAQFREMVETVVWQGTFGGRFEDRDHAIEVFRRHTEEVRRALPPKRLLVYEVGQGWEPLCAFLDVPVPDEPFPHLNDTASFHARVEAGEITQLLSRPAPGASPEPGPSDGS